MGRTTQHRIARDKTHLPYEMMRTILSGLIWSCLASSVMRCGVLFHLRLVSSRLALLYVVCVIIVFSHTLCGTAVWYRLMSLRTMGDVSFRLALSHAIRRVISYRLG